MIFQLLSRAFELGAYNDFMFASTVDAVCQRWHRLARKLPSIWGNIVLSPHWTHSLLSFHQKMNQCLIRSVPKPLLVNLDLCGIDALEEARALLTALAPHITRCYSFAISVPQPDWIELIGQCFGGALAAGMVSLSLHFRPISPWAAAYIQSTILQGSMPLLSTLVLEGLPLTALNVSLPGLRRFEYKQFEDVFSYPQNANAVTRIGDLWNILRRAPNIEDLRIEHSSFDTNEDSINGDISNRVAMPHLNSLRVGHVDAGFAHLLIEGIDAPALETLSLHCDPMRQYRDLWWVPVSRVSRLRTLILDGVRILDGSPMISLTRLLNSTKFLKTLSIETPATIFRHMTAAPQFFATLSKPAPSGKWLCPELTDFTISHCNLVSGHELLQLVRAREQSRAVSGIQFLGIKECAAFDVSTMDEIERRVPTVVYLPPQSPPDIHSSPVHWDQPTSFP